MKVSFRSRKLQKTCNAERQMVRSYGVEMAGKLRQRLAELSAADCLLDISHLPPARCHQLTEGRDKGKFSVDLKHPYRLLFVPLNGVHPETGVVDLAATTEIEIVEIKDTH